MENNITRDQVKELVYDIVKEKLVYDETWWNRNSADGENLLWYEEIGADSLDTIEIIMEIERELHVILPDDTFEHISTLGGIIDKIYREKVKQDANRKTS